MKGRLKIYSNQLLFTDTLFQALKISNERNLKILSIWHPQAVWTLFHDPPHFKKFYQKSDHDHNSVTCVQPNGYTFFLASPFHDTGQQVTLYNARYNA